MEIREKREESNSKMTRMSNVMKIFGSSLVADKQWNEINHKNQSIAHLNDDSKLPQIVALRPSEYMSQLSMTTAERVELLTKTRLIGDRGASIGSNDFRGFEAVPNVVVFQQYRPGNVYNVAVNIRNTTKASHCLRLTCEMDSAFIVECKGNPSLNIRLAAGMHSTYNVRFAPEENRDYDYELKFLSDRGSFAIPVIAIGPRPILDFPNVVVVPETAVKIASVKSLLVRNLGDREAAFNVTTTNPYFWLEPCKGVIEEEETVQFFVNFLSEKSGFFEGCFFLTYDTGEVVRIEVQGSAVDCNVRLERGSVRMQEETYLGLSTSKTLKIFNRSDYIINYQWMRYEDSDADSAKKKEYEKIFELIHNSEKKRCADLVHYNICTPEVHELVCQRIYADEIATLTNEKFYYQNTHFSLVPMEGEIWPQSSVEVTIYFEPNEIGELSSTAYLELTGHENRLPLSLTGLSIGPLLTLDVGTINVDNIFLCSLQNYQVVCTNKGVIPGVLVHRPKPSDFGGTISVTPERMKLQPGEFKNFNVSFTSNKIGDFVETVEFVVRESLQVVAMYIRGCVVCPTLYFDKNLLDFGITATGFESEREAVLHNDSLVPVTFSICVPDDGHDAVVTNEQFFKFPRKSLFPSSPREFEIHPHEGVVEARSSLEVKINFTPNRARIANTCLRVDMWDTESVPVSLPISIRSQVASIIVKPPKIDLRLCFLNFPYVRTFTVVNDSEVDGCFCILPQSISDSETLQYSISTDQGCLGPGQSMMVSLTITTTATGEQKSIMRMLTFGEKGPLDCCILTCNGQGPVVSVQPTSLDYGDVELLHDKIMLLTLTNDSPIPAEFEASLSNKNSSWSVFPSSGNLDPGKSIDLRSTVLLRDVGKHCDKTIVTIRNSRDLSVSVSAIGIGSCIVCDPPIFPTFDMGLLFSKQNTSLPIEVNNLGSRNAKIVFSNSMEVRLMHGGQVQPPTYDKFAIEPLVVELPAQSTKKIFCNAQSNGCEIVSEQWWLHCFFEGQGKREILGKSLFTAKFVEPSISFSKRELNFRIDAGRDDEKLEEIDDLFVTNESALDLRCILKIDEPFELFNDDGDRVQRLEIFLKEHDKFELRVGFAPKDGKKNFRSKTYNGILRLECEEHPHAVKIKCQAAINYPNIAQLPKAIILDCPLGCSVVENIILKNSGPLDVSYKFFWIEESISIVHVQSSSQKIVEVDDGTTKKTFRKEDQSECSKLLADTRDLILEILTENLSKDERSMLDDLEVTNESRVIEEINQIFSIVPSQGTVPAHSSQCVALGFHGLKILTLEAKLVFEIDGGPSDFIEVIAAADDLKFHLEKDRIDFGQQPIFERICETIKLKNLSRMKINYRIERAEKFDESLEIRPTYATIPVQSTVEIEIISRPVIPGTYKNRFDICVEHCKPISIIVEGVAVISQVCVALPRNDIFKNYSVELGYRAIQISSESSNPDILEEDENGWQLVINDETLPTARDIEMALERFIAKEFIEETYSFVLDKTTRSKGDGPIPYLVAPEYVLDMGYVIVGKCAEASTLVYNYGFKSVKVRLNKSNKMEQLAKQGIIVQFTDQNSLMPGEYANLEVTFNPSRLKNSDESSVVKKKFYLEVTNGFTLPIAIVAVVTYPFVTVSPTILEFSDVLVGECMLMHLFIRNEGLIDCEWEAKLPPTRRNQIDGPFSLQNTSNVYSPGQSGSIRIYFKPQKSGYVESKLTLEIRDGLKPTIVEIRGRGIEHRLKILPTSISFTPVLPYDSAIGKNFTVENIGQRAVEICWKHLEHTDLQEQRIIRVLAHYYQVDEILLPPQRPPFSSILAPQLFDFYNSLVNEMSLSAAPHRKLDDKRTDDDEVTVASYSEDEPRSKRRASTNRKISKKLTRPDSVATPISDVAQSIFSEYNVDEGKKNYSTHEDPNEIEKLLHCFIDDLQKKPDFLESMKDPVKEVFESLTEKQSKTDNLLMTNEKKICIIFHGESSTDYEQAACKTSRALGIPLLNLNNAITEMIALGNTACSAKLREIIDVKYRELLTAIENVEIEDTKKPLTIEKLSGYDSLTRYEHKIEAIRNCQERNDIFVTGSALRDGGGSAKRADKSPQTTREEFGKTFLDIDVRFFIELLEQRLTIPDLKEKFVLQTLRNNFIESEEKSLVVLLRIIGNVDYPIFVTFHKFIDRCEFMSRGFNDNAETESTDGILGRLMEIDDMSSLEFDDLSNIEKELYREKILRVRSQEAQLRRKEFQTRISEIRKQKNQNRKSVSRNDKSRNVKKNKSKTVQQSSRASDGLTTVELSNKKKNPKIESAKSSGRKKLEQMETVGVDIQEPHHPPLTLETILSILQTWDPTRKSISSNHKETGQSKTLKNSKKDRPTTAAGKIPEVNDRFWIWQVNVNPSDPTSSEEMIVNELIRHEELLNPKEKSSSEVEPELSSQVYSVIRPKKLTPAMSDTENIVEQAKIFDIVALKCNSSLSTENSSRDETITSDLDEESLHPRFVLEPQESRIFRVHFRPRIVGNFEEEFSLVVVNSRDSSYGIRVDGYSDIPRLNLEPSIMFKKIKEIKTNEMNDATYFTDIQTFDFGSLLLTDRNKKIHRKKTFFKFCNASTMNLDLDISLFADNWKAYDIEPRKLSIKPNDCGLINVTASATKLGPNEERLLLTMKGNPRVEFIQMRSNGAKLEIGLNGKQISFGRVLINRQATETLRVINDSLVAIYWRITAIDSIDPQIEVSPTMGWTKAKAESNIIFTYLANRISVLETKTMAFEVFLNEEDCHEDPLFKDIVTVSGETYDVAVDIVSANPIDLPTVIVGSIASAGFTMKNRGAYEINFVFELDKNMNPSTEIVGDLRKNFKEDFHISPSVGTIGPEKSVALNVNFQPKFEMRLKKASIFRCNLYDANDDATIVAEFPITVSVASYYVRFRLIPDSEISFGPVSVCTNKILDLSIENIGIFPVKYQLKNVVQLPLTIEEGSKRQRKDKSARTDINKHGTGKSREVATNFRVGSFAFSKFEGNVAPGDVEILKIDCHPETEGRLEERILIFVEGSADDDRSGRMITLNVDSCIPIIDFSDFDAMFPDSYLVDDIQHFIRPKQIDDHTIFSRDARHLYFEGVVINKTHTATMKLFNRGTVPARVTVSLRPDSGTPNSEKSEAFVLSTVQETVLPMSSQIFAVSFTPNLIETYTGFLEARVELPPQLKTDSIEKLSIKLSGEGCVPEVILLEPTKIPSTKRRGTWTIGFPKCLLRDTSSRNFALKNIGRVTARVVVGIHHDSNKFFAIHTTENIVVPTALFQSDDAATHEDDKRTAVFNVRPDEVARFFVEFRPNAVGRNAAEIRINVLDNPYENLTIDLDGEGFVKNVVFMGLPIVEIPRSGGSNGHIKLRKITKHPSGSSTSNSSHSASSAPILIYDLDYGTCFVNKMYKINFQIANKSSDRCFRFELSPHPNVVFVPSIGHLQNDGIKNITATFLATEPIVIKQFNLDCVIQEIFVGEEFDKTNLWDDRETRIEWITDDSRGSSSTNFEDEFVKKIIVPSVEPYREIVNGSERIVRLIFSAIVAFTEYFCNVREINFMDTLMFQSREYSFSVKNSGDVDTVFDWKIEMDVEYPRRLTDGALRSTSLRPKNSRSDDSRPSSRSSGGVLYPEADEKRSFRCLHSRHQRGDEENSKSSNLGDNCRPLSSQDKLRAIAIEPYTCPCGPGSDLFSVSAARTQRSTESWIDDGDDQPFNVKPNFGVIPAGQSLKFILRFSPLDVFDYKAYLTCQIENLSPNLDMLVIPVTARSLLPYCHFEIEDNDSPHERPTNEPIFSSVGAGDANDTTSPRVVEFRAIGIGDCHEKKFWLINPTTEDYRFDWNDVTDRAPEQMPYFHCANENGLAESGKRSKVLFTFFAEDIGIFESLWRFTIDKYGLTTMFRLVAIVAEPAVRFLDPRFKMKPTVLGSTIEDNVIIVNDENFELTFKIIRRSLRSQEHNLQTLKVTPMTGVLGPKCQQVFQVSFVPSSVGEFSFAVQCQVQRMKRPLSVFVTAKVGQVVPRVMYGTDREERSSMLEANHDRETILDFGKLTLNKPVTIGFEIANVGDVAFHWAWNLGSEDPEGAYGLSVSTETELVPRESVSTCYLELIARRKTMIRHHPVTLTIGKGPVYRMFVKASAKNPSLEFSFSDYDFGPCYIRDKNAPPYVIQLSVTNNDRTPTIIESDFPENLPHLTIDLEALARAIPGKSSISLPINFRPLDQSRYNEKLNFFTNDSVIRQTIGIKGEGICHKICLANVRDKFVEFGNVTVGKIVTRKIRVLNAGRLPVEINFDLVENFSNRESVRRFSNDRPDESVVRSKKNITESRRSYRETVDKEENFELLKKFLNVQPREKTLLPVNKSIDVIVRFKPTMRMSSFVEKIGARLGSIVLPIFFVRGSSVAREFRLDRNQLYFGTIVEACDRETKIVLQNLGDFGSKFRWNVDKLEPNFRVKPISGYCSPGMDVTFTIIFHPIQRATLLEAEAYLDVEKYSSLKLYCSGGCCKIPDPIEIIKFSVPVRTVQTKGIKIMNDSNVHWNVEMILSGEFFSTDENVSIAANESCSCRITYAPLVMNNDKNPHEGKLIVKLPNDKQPLVYTLFGQSLKPLVVAKILRQLPAKTKYSELLPVRNWLKKSQTFRCDIKLLNDLKMNEIFYSFTGNSKIDISANGTRDFRASFYCYKEASLDFQITFTNNEGEYEFYEVHYKVSKPEILSTIKLTTSARISTFYSLKIENPLEDRNVTFTATCQHRDVTIENVPRIVSAKKNENIVINYLPFLPSEAVAKLEINCPELGNFPYELRLKATAAAPEKVTRVTATLGSFTNFFIVIANPTKKTAEFTVKVDDPSFTCDKIIKIPSQNKYSIEIIYEPCDANNVTTVLHAVSETLGQFIFPLIGCYTLPKPQGPLTIFANSSLDIFFKNIFSTTKTFAFTLDGPDEFSMATSSITIESKKTATIVVKLRSPEDRLEKSLVDQYPVTAKLVIFCNEPAISHIAWVYYLRGIVQ